MLSVNTNISSLNAQRSLLSNSQGAAVAMERLASGKRINFAKDDAAGLAVSSRLESQVKGVTQGIRNLSDATSVLQVAEGGMASIETNLQRIRELAVQAANGSYSDADRSSMNNEATQLLADIDRVTGTTSFGGQSLLDGTFTNKSFNLGNAGEDLSISVGKSDSTTLLSESALTTLGNAGTVSNSENSRRARVSNDNSGEHVITWEYVAYPNLAYSFLGNSHSEFQRLNNLGTEVFSRGATSSLASDGYTPEVTLLGNGSYVHVSNDSTPYVLEDDTVLEVVIKDSSDNVIKSFSLTDATGLSSSYDILHLPSVVDLGNSKFMIAYSPFAASPSGQSNSKGGLNGGAAQVFDYSGNLVQSEFSIIADTSTNAAWIHEPVHLSGNTIAVPVIDNTAGSGTNMSIRLMDWPTQAALSDISIESTSGQIAAEEHRTAPISNPYPRVGNIAPSLRLLASSDTLAAFWMNTDDSKLYGQTFDFSGNALTSKTELAGDADYLNAIHTVVSGNDYFDVLYGENSTGTEKTLFQRFDTDLNALISSPTTIFNGKGSQAELVELGDGTLRAYESYDFASAIGYQDFTVTHHRADISTQVHAQELLSKIDTSLETLNTNRSELGAQMNRIESAISTLQITKENSAAAKSRIVDADYAAETARMAKHQILQQASISVLAQANARSEMVLALLRDL